MTLIRTTQAGYVYRPDVYTDEHGRSFAVYPDTDAEDPRTWSAIEEAALVVIDGDRNTCIDTLCDYQETPPSRASTSCLMVWAPMTLTRSPSTSGALLCVSATSTMT